MIIVLIVGHDFLANQRLVQAVKLKGLIYNRDGKFIYRPPRANQAHIIVIDDRSPKSSNEHQSNKTEVSKHSSGENSSNNNQDSSATQVNPALLQLFANQQLASKGLYASGNPFRLVNLNDVQSLGQQPQLKAQISARASQGQPVLPAAFMPHAGLGGIQMVPMIQFVPQPAIAGMNPRTGQSDSAMGQNAAIYQAGVESQMAGFASASTELGSAIGEAPLEPYQMARASGFEAPQAYYQPAMVRQRYVSAYPEPQGHQMPVYPDYPQQRMEPTSSDQSPFDEPLASSRGGGGGGGNAYISQLNHQQAMKSRRAAAASAAGPPVQDLDDVEGDHVEYYDADMRGAARASYGSRSSNANNGPSQRQYFSKPSSPYGPDSSLTDDSSSGYQRQVGTAISFGGMNEAAASGVASSAPVSQQSVSLGAIPGSTHESRPVGLMKRLKTNAPAKPKLAPPRLMAPKPLLGAPTIPLDEPTNAPDEKDPKNLEYWKQYQDQFNIV